ncbi:MAG: YqaJ viral recombinase family protein [Bacteroidales bacterium]|jgi:exodeoxyribonuclease (lambda-induced)|nr:YqaJ viral recombinase family protein [Bacteroidales bacterium]
MKVKIHNMEQRSDEWFAIKKGKASASRAQAIGNGGKGLENYVIEIMAEYYSIAERENYINEHMQRGIELEPIAKQVYELEHDCEVREIGFAEYNEYIGCSPDGLVGKDGMIEIKCPCDRIYLGILINEKIDSGYEWQCQMNMLILKRKWCDLIFYNPNFKRSMYIKRLKADKKAHEKLLKGFIKVEEEIKKIKNKIKIC